jgi:hypothetical protein
VTGASLPTAVEGSYHREVGGSVYSDSSAESGSASHLSNFELDHHLQTIFLLPSRHLPRSIGCGVILNIFSQQDIEREKRQRQRERGRERDDLIMLELGAKFDMGRSTV